MTSNWDITLRRCRRRRRQWLGKKPLVLLVITLLLCMYAIYIYTNYNLEAITYSNVYCHSNVEVGNSRIVLLREATIDGHFVDHRRHADETSTGIPIKGEIITLKQGFLHVPCNKFPLSHLPRVYDYLSKSIHSELPNYIGNYVTRFTVLKKRGDYANLYWGVIDVYNTYLTIKLFNENPRDVQVILLDEAPNTTVDGLWKMVFGNVRKVKTLSKEMNTYRGLAWGIDTFSGPITAGVSNLRFMSDLRDDLYMSGNLSVPAIPVCANGPKNMKITIILRRNYYAHPWNPSGRVKRKFENEKDVVDRITKDMAPAQVLAVQLDKLPFSDQLKIIYNTDILVGVHGAGLGHTAFLRPGAGLIELFPTSYRVFRNNHFQQFANWANVKYSSWYNFDILCRDLEYLYVPPDALLKKLREMVSKICIA